MVSRALPLLLVFVTFLFINAEVWEVASNLDGGSLWLVAVLFGLRGGRLFLLVRLPEEVDRVDDDGRRRLPASRACRGTPLEEASRALAAGPRRRPRGVRRGDRASSAGT